MGLYRGCIGFGDITPRMENHMEKTVRYEMETGIMLEPYRVGTNNPAAA